jgi:hypothetical protein
MLIYLTYANLSYANLSNANLENANLENANLYNANLYGIKITKIGLKSIITILNIQIYEEELDEKIDVNKKDIILNFLESIVDSCIKENK